MSGKGKQKRSEVFFDVAIAGESAGRVVIELFDDLLPKTCANFRSLCSGERGIGSHQKPLCYKGSKFHRVIRGFMVQGGDITHGNGIGGESIYGAEFADEGFPVGHDREGLLSMANRGPNTNGSQFFLTCAACPHLDGKHVVFGQVVQGMRVVRAVENVPVNLKNRPKFPVTISECGDMEVLRKIEKEIEEEMLDTRLQLSGDELDDEPNTQMDEDSQRELDMVDAVFDFRQRKAGESPDADTTSTAQETQDASDALPPFFSDPLQKRLFELQQKKNEARKLNREAVKREYQGLKQGTQPRKRSRHEWEAKKKGREEQMAATFRDPKQPHLYESVEYAAKRRKKAKGQAFGWDVFNQDTLYEAYKRRCARIKHKGVVKDPTTLANADELGYGGNTQDDPEAVEAMVAELKETEKRRKKFQRRRTYYAEADVTFINKRNEVFNRKVERAYGKYTAEIRANLERGTAL